MHEYRVGFIGPGGATPTCKLQAADHLSALVAAKGPTLDGTRAMVLGPKEGVQFIYRDGKWEESSRVSMGWR